MCGPGWKSLGQRFLDLILTMACSVRGKQVQPRGESPLNKHQQQV